MNQMTELAAIDSAPQLSKTVVVLKESSTNEINADFDVCELAQEEAVSTLLSRTKQNELISFWNMSNKEKGNRREQN